MGLVIDVFGTGKGISWHNAGGLQGSYQIWGHSFNPTSNTGDGSQSWDIWADYYPSGVTTCSILSPSASFDLTGFQHGQEVVMGVLQFTSDQIDNGEITLTMKDPDGATLYTYADTWSFAAAPSLGYFFLGIGVGGNGDEIWKNGNYTFSYTVTYNGGVDSLSDTCTFAVTNMPTVTTSTEYGAIWVEGDNLCFIARDGYKITCKNDGSSAASGASGGYFWFETDGKISYVDASGNERKTKLGDRYGYGGWASELPSSPGVTHKGAYWVCDDNNDTYLMIVSDNGVKYRIGAGYADSGDYQ